MSYIFLTMIIGCFVPIYEFKSFFVLFVFAFKHHNHCAYSFISLIYKSVKLLLLSLGRLRCRGSIYYRLVSGIQFLTNNSPTRVGWVDIVDYSRGHMAGYDHRDLEVLHQRPVSLHIALQDASVLGVTGLPYIFFFLNKFIPYQTRASRAPA